MFSHFALPGLIVFALQRALAQPQQLQQQPVQQQQYWVADDFDARTVTTPTLSPSAENNIFIALAIASAVILIILGFILGYWIGTVQKQSRTQTTLLMAQRSGALASGVNYHNYTAPFHGGMPDYQYQHQPPPVAPGPPMLQHRQTSAAVATLTHYSNAAVASGNTSLLASMTLMDPERRSKLRGNGAR